MSILSVPLVSTYREIAEAATRSDANQTLEQVRKIRAQSNDDAAAHSSAVETAFRELLIELIASLDIEHNDFSPIWSLFDTINLLCDSECCETALSFWLIEDLLDSQTVSGCREVFKYLESRRERMTKVNFRSKHLTILRCCNELLRRLSRAEDTVFCGRVFIYLFQSFPLSDKSSVNLRGDFHVENVTTYDEDSGITAREDESMDVDQKEEDKHNTELQKLYPTFWSLQSLFSSPTRLFEPASMSQFKSAIAETLDCFKQVAKDTPATTSTAEVERRGTKRKADNLNGNLNGDTTHHQGTNTSASTFNPKYLTSPALFPLELHDTDFRRHILVQSLITLDFITSLSATQKTKLLTKLGTSASNIVKTLYDKHTLSPDDVSWCTETRQQIEDYLGQTGGLEGRYYLRMVNMVLSRDRNWSYWKAAGCPPISQPPVPESDISSSQTTLQNLSQTANKPLTKVKGVDQLSFLSQPQHISELRAKRVHVPSLEDYHKDIQTIDLDMDFASEEEKKELEEQKAGKLWRALRSAKGKRFTLCEEIKSGEDLDALIGKRRKTEEDDGGEGGGAGEEKNAVQVSEEKGGAEMQDDGEQVLMQDDNMEAGANDQDESETKEETKNVEESEMEETKQEA